MARYHGRHAARHARPSSGPTAAVSSALRRPAVSSSLALAMMATGAATLSSQEDAEADAAAFTVTSDVVALGSVERQQGVEDADRIATARTRVNTERARIEGQAAEAARRKAAALAKARREAAQRVARAKARKKAISRAQDNPRAAARALLSDYGFGDNQWQCLEKLWMGESGWRYTAMNASSGAYGIPQSLPGSKMGSVASDWRSNPVTQIKWGLGYIKQVYGSPCGAWGSWQARSPHWY